ncbi:MAG: SDR family oxidoreductase, partial [Dehalococcoidales bacterium]|nr:SDR family oxidoreductase [Dehalococcoidales bacterium]
MELGLKDKVAIVTGAGSQIGFGRGIAMTLAKEGCDLVVADIDMAGAEKTASDIQGLGRRAIAVKTDVRSLRDAEAMAKAAMDRFGKIDILVNNAGTSSIPKPFLETTEADWDIDINVNLRGVLNCTKAVLPYMVARKYGKVINISSGVGVTGMPTGAVYAAAKAGVIAFTKSMAKAMISQGIYFNNVAPGIGDTGLLRVSKMPPGFLERVVKTVPLGRATTPEDIGAMVAFLASDISSDIVGQTFSVD